MLPCVEYVGLRSGPNKCGSIEGVGYLLCPSANGDHGGGAIPAETKHFCLDQLVAVLADIVCGPLGEAWRQEKS